MKSHFYLSQCPKKPIQLATLCMIAGVFMFSCTGNQQNSSGTETRDGVTSSTQASVHQDHDHSAQNTWQVVAGQMQSPIHIMSDKAVDMIDSGSMYIHHASTIFTVENRDQKLYAQATAETFINGRSFDIHQFHLHSPAEHVLDGKTHELELHYVHVSQSGRLAVLAVFLTTGEYNEAFQTLLTELDNSNTSIQPFDTTTLFPEDLTYYHYLGSLTEPPLSENVEWYVFAQPVEISAEQLAAYRRHEGFHGTARHLQPLHDRPILRANAAQ
jgi:carbonic anhydrase